MNRTRKRVLIAGTCVAALAIAAAAYAYFTSTGSGTATAKVGTSSAVTLKGTVAGNLALTVGARGGVFIAGGIVPRVLDAFSSSQFRERFEAKGTYREYMAGIPTHVITAPLPAFRGLSMLLGHE